MQLYPFRHVPSNSFTGNRRSRGVRPDKQKRRVVLIEEDWSGVRGGKWCCFWYRAAKAARTSRGKDVCLQLPVSHVIRRARWTFRVCPSL